MAGDPRSGVAAARRRRPVPRPAPARAAPDVRRRVPGPRARGRRAVRARVPRRARGRQGARDLVDPRHRRLRRGLRAVAVHRGHGRCGLRRGRSDAGPGPARAGRGVRGRRDGGGVRRVDPRTDHGGHHALRVDRRLRARPAGRRRGRHRDGGVEGPVARHRVHAQAQSPRRRPHRLCGSGPPADRYDGRWCGSAGRSARAGDRDRRRSTRGRRVRRRRTRRRGGRRRVLRGCGVGPLDRRGRPHRRRRRRPSGARRDRRRDGGPDDAVLDSVVQDVVEAADTAGLPVVDTDGRPVGWLGQAEALRALVSTR